jgi:peptide/nickel transport system permease protein
MVSLGFIVLLMVVALLDDALAPQDPNKQVLLDRLQGPSAAHWLGTDGFGRDVLSRLVVATRVAVVAAVQAVGLALVLGAGLGVVSGYRGAAVDTVLSRIVDSLMALPGLVLALAVVGVLGPGLTNAMIAIGILLSPRFFRIARGATQAVRHETYIDAARAMGCRSTRIMWRHVLPNIASPLLVQTSFAIGIAVLAESGLSFLGLGVQVPQASWGSMLDEAFSDFRETELPLLPPIVMIVATILATSLLGDALRDATGREGQQ